MVQGVGRYAREGQRWQPMIPWADLDRWCLPEGMRVDGVIAFPNTRERIDFLLGLSCPVVCMGPHFSSDVKLPRVDCDDELAGRMAVGHLVGLGIKRIAFVGENFELGYLARRLQGARSVAAEHGLDIEALELEPGGHRAGKAGAIARRETKWLKGIEPPFGVVAATDITGFDLLNILRASDIGVPEQAAVISIGGDNVLCPFGDPALSSVELPGDQVGYEAARMLDHLLDNQAQEPGEQLRVPPRRVVARRSSDIVASGDEMVRRALSFIREHAGESICVGDVLAVVPLSRRPL
jgi:LacI family transcriptional regulator